jgi:hypothetical protein
MMNRKGILVLGLLGMVGGGMLGCVPTRQIVQVEPPAATPTPGAEVSPTPETAAAALTPVVTPAAIQEPVAAPAQASSKVSAAPRTQAREAQPGTHPPKEAAAPAPGAQPLPAGNSDAVPAGEPAASDPRPETAVSDASQTAGAGERSSSSNQIGRLFMGIGFLILFGGILYALKQFQEKRSLRRNLSAVSLPAEGKQETGRSASASTGASGVKIQDAGSSAMPRLRTPSSEPRPLTEIKKETAAQTEAGSPTAIKKKRVSVVSKTLKTGARKPPQKAALRIARPAVKTVRLAGTGTVKKTTGPSRRKKA